MTDKINLSYVMSTRNKFPYLQEVLPRLIQHRQPDEEIVIVDGGSTDGTVEYLQELQKENCIQQFISEPDTCEAHGTNKGLLMARGELIKLITDDDVFYWSGIQACKKYMLEHPEVDILGANGAATRWEKRISIFPLNMYSQKYKIWRKSHVPFEFCGLGLFIRRQSLPLIGLMDTSFFRTDYEFSLRLTSGRANLAWFTGYLYVRISNPQSISLTHNQAMIEDKDILDLIYLAKLAKSRTKIGLKIKDYFRFIRKINSKIIKKKDMDNTHSLIREQLTNFSYNYLYSFSDQWLVERNKSYPCAFLVSDNKKPFQEIYRQRSKIIQSLQKEAHLAHKIPN